MVRDSARDTVQQLQTLLTLGAVGGLSDAELLRCFLSPDGGDAEAAFRVLVSGTGPWSWGSAAGCWSITTQRKTRFRRLFWSWFVGLELPAGRRSWRTGCTELPSGLRKRQGGPGRDGRPGNGPMPEQQLVEGAVETGPARVDLQSVLDEELSRLPGRYRAALVICELEGKSRREAALLLGVPEGTLSSHLVRGRESFASDSRRRGFSTTACPLVALAPLTWARSQLHWQSSRPGPLCGHYPGRSGRSRNPFCC